MVQVQQSDQYVCLFFSDNNFRTSVWPYFVWSIILQSGIFGVPCSMLNDRCNTVTAIIDAPAGQVTLGASVQNGLEQKGIETITECIKKCVSAGGGVPAAVPVCRAYACVNTIFSPRGMHIICSACVIFFELLSKENSGYTGPIFTKFYGRLSIWS